MCFKTLFSFSHLRSLYARYSSAKVNTVSKSLKKSSEFWIVKLRLNRSPCLRKHAAIFNVIRNNKAKKICT